MTKPKARTKNEFFAKYDDPRWQKKRLEVMERAGWACEWCGTKTEKLNVHHGYYLPNREPWEYPNESLWCMCEECHQEAHGRLSDAKMMLGCIHPRFIRELCEMFNRLTPSEVTIAGGEKYATVVDPYYGHSREFPADDWWVRR